MSLQISKGGCWPIVVMFGIVVAAIVTLCLYLPHLAQNILTGCVAVGVLIVLMALS